MRIGAFKSTGPCHAGNIENERCDVLAVAATKGEDLQEDVREEAAVLFE